MKHYPLVLIHGIRTKVDSITS